MKQKYSMRALQIDLARQMESVPFLKSFIDFAAENHYNTILFYLEWRIRTKTFDIGKDKGYSEKELRELVDYAELRGIQIIPGLATLGHSSLLLSQEKYVGLAELRDEKLRGRFGGHSCSDLCPSLPEVRKFLKSYLTDVAKIFDKTPYFHVGCDEAWDMNFCEECRKVTGGDGGEGKLFLEHLKFLRDVCHKLDKRIMIWDDMFEFYPEMLKDAPRDVIMVCWQYDENIPSYRGHFRNACFHDRLTQYDNLGFDYLIAPSDYIWNNTVSFTGYGNKCHPMGALMTTWEKYASLMYRSYPVIAMAGQLWGQKNAADPESAAITAISQLFGVDDELFIHAMITYADLHMKTPAPDKESLMSFGYFGPDHTRINALQTTFAILSQYPGKLKDTRAEIVLKEVLCTTILTLLSQRCEVACWNLLHGMQGESLSELAKEVKKAGATYMDFCKPHRNGEVPYLLEAWLKNWLNGLADIEKSLKNGCSTIKILFSQPDYYVAEKTQIFVNGEAVASGVYKHIPDALYEQFIFIPKHTKVKEIRLDVTGYGGQGIAYVSAASGKDLYRPAGITGVQGLVDHPECVLSPDVSAAFFGIRSIGDIFYDRHKAGMINSITLSMEKEE